MFKNYSKTYATQLATLAGAIVVFGRIMGWELMEVDVVFVLGVLTNFGGIIYNLYKRYENGDITFLGVRK